MPIRKLQNGRWQVDLNTPEKRIRKQFKTKLEASRFEQFILSKTEAAKEWMVSGDSRRLSELVKLWYDHHGDRKSTRLNSSHVKISYAVFCLKKKKHITRVKS